ncbi:hypothetical protein FQN57_001858 [Myotisia sp. PD_48]|nr:hypothetical protein FQN57_001858 [Myotisia sp. PD_48]
MASPPTASSPTDTRPRVPIRTYHCRFCNHLLIASTYDLARLPKRRAPALDNAIILPISKSTTNEEEEEEDARDDDDEQEEEDIDDHEQAKATYGRKGETAQQTSDNMEIESDTDVAQGRRKKKFRTGHSRSSSSSSSKHSTILLSTTTPDRKPIILRRSDGFEKRLLVRCGRCKVVLGYVLDEVHFKKGNDSSEHQTTESIAEKEPDILYVLPGALAETHELDKEVHVGREAWAEWESLVPQTT